MSKIVLLINKQDILKRTSLSGNVDFDKIVPNIVNAQEVELVRLLGDGLYKALLKMVSDGSIDDPINMYYAELYNDYVRPALTFYTMEQFLPFHQYQLANAGISRPTGENIETISKEEVDYLVQKYRNLADSYAVNLDKFLCLHSQEFQDTSSFCGINGKEPARYRTGLYLG